MTNSFLRKGVFNKDECDVLLPFPQISGAAAEYPVEEAFPQNSQTVSAVTDGGEFPDFHKFINPPRIHVEQCRNPGRTK